MGAKLVFFAYYSSFFTFFYAHLEKKRWKRTKQQISSPCRSYKKHK